MDRGVINVRRKQATPRLAPSQLPLAANNQTDSPLLTAHDSGVKIVLRRAQPRVRRRPSAATFSCVGFQALLSTATLVRSGPEAPAGPLKSVTRGVGRQNTLKVLPD